MYPGSALLMKLSIIQMHSYLTPVLTGLLLIFFISCNNDTGKCEQVGEWNVQQYRIVKYKCPDIVPAFHYEYIVYKGEKNEGDASQVDSCIFNWQADHERFLILNACDDAVQERRPQKVALNPETIDSITIFSNELRQTLQLKKAQIKTFAKDWNNSKTRGYHEEPFDSAFVVFPAYQYKLTVFSGSDRRSFYGYNYLILDSSNWKYEMSNSGNLNYFRNYWKRAKRSVSSFFKQ